MGLLIGIKEYRPTKIQAWTQSIVSLDLHKELEKFVVIVVMIKLIVLMIVLNAVLTMKAMDINSYPCF